MTIKELFKRSSKPLLLFIALTMVLKSFDGVILAQVVSGVTSFSQFSSEQDILRFVSIAIVAYVAVLFSGHLNTLFRMRLMAKLNQELKTDYMMSSLQASNHKTDTDELVSFMLNDFPLVESNYMGVLLDVASYAVTSLVSAIYMLSQHSLLALLFIFCAFLPMLPPVLLGKYLEKRSLSWSTSNERYVGTLKSIFGGRKTLKTYQAYPFAQEQLNQSLAEMENESRLFQNAQSLVGFSVAVVSWLSYLIPITVSLFMVIKGQLEPRIVLALFLSNDRVVYPLRSIAMLLGKMATTTTVRQKISSFLGHYQPTAVNPTTESIDLTLENVSFSYSDVPLLEHVNETFVFGKKYLITGPSGSGKTTLLDLLQGVIEAQSGHIYGLDSSSRGRTDYQSAIARINQEVVLFKATLRDNLCLGRNIPDDKLLALLHDLGLVDELGDNVLDLMVDDKVMTLSGGQKQRLEIARAILQDKKILLVDEATSALDETNAKNVRTLLLNLPITVIEVAHHFDKADVDHHYDRWIDLSVAVV